MKYILTTILALVLSYTASANVSSFADTVYSASVDSAISIIESKHSVINNSLPSYRVKEKDIEGLSTEGGIVKGYFSGNDLKKITVILYGETGFTSEDYYYERGKLLYMFSQLSLYDKSHGEVISRSTNKYYFNSSKLIAWFNDENLPVNNINNQYKEAEDLVLYNSKNFVRFIGK